MKLAIVHDFLNQYGGAERCVEAFHEIFPEAPIYTSIYLPDNMPDSFRKMDIRTSFMQRLPFLKKHFKKYLLFYPKAIESFDLRAYDVILSSSSAFAKGAKKNPKSVHICYCYTPANFIWDYNGYVKKEKFHYLTTFFLRGIIARLKKWDLKTNHNVDHFIAIAKVAQAKIKRYYSKESDIIYPPVENNNFSIADKIEDYFLIVSRLTAYKGIGIVVEAFNKLKLPLKIVGDGPCRDQLMKIAGPNISFIGKLDDKELAKAYSHCQAAIFFEISDFGIVPLEAQASGRPVIACAGGGALETVIDRVTGIFFKEQNCESIIDAVTRFLAVKSSFKSEILRQNALKYNKDRFKTEILNFVNSRYKKHIQGQQS